jgi:hypothetical protein
MAGNAYHFAVIATSDSERLAADCSIDTRLRTDFIYAANNGLLLVSADVSILGFWDASAIPKG